jgi:hypothetical protein
VLRAFVVAEAAVRISVAQGEQQRDLVEGPLRHSVNAMYLRQKAAQLPTGVPKTIGMVRTSAQATAFVVVSRAKAPYVAGRILRSI